MNSCFVAFLTGTLAGVLVSLIPILIFFTLRLPQTVFITTIISAALINPLIFCISMKAVIKSLPVKKFLVIGKQAEIEPIFKEIEERSMGKIKAYMYMNPSAVALEREIAIEPAFHQILVADPLLEKTVEPQLQNAKRQGIEIDYLPNLVEEYLQRIPIHIAEKFKEYYAIAFDNIQESTAKRVLDVFIS
ncbi:MAG: exopolysaccharide biosynthesis polyprenyl glycosylphosphotransferase, partial [Bacteroidota bacterium]